MTLLRYYTTGGQRARLEVVLPHHRLDGSRGLLRVLGVLLLTIRDSGQAVDSEVDQLTDGHVWVNSDGFVDRDLKSPMAAEAHVALARCGMYVDAKPPR